MNHIEPIIISAALAFVAIVIVGVASSYHNADKACDQDRGVVVRGAGGKYHCIKADAVLK